MNQSERRQYLIRSLLNENLAYRDWGVPQGADDQKRLLRGLMNVRPAQNTNAEFLIFRTNTCARWQEKRA